MKTCLTIDPTNRPTAAELLEHPWLKTEQKAVDLLPNVKAAFDAKKTCEYLSLSQVDVQSEKQSLV